jgi:hypothetical protein
MGVDLFAITGAGVDAFVTAHRFSNLTGALASLAGRRAEAPADVFTHEHAPQVGGFILFALAVVLLARVLVMAPLCLLANRFRGPARQLSRQAVAMLIFSGLRGAIAFALAHNLDSEHGTTIAAATTTIVLFTTFVLGGLTRRMLRCLRMEASVSDRMLSATDGRSDAGEPDDERAGGAASSGGAAAVGRLTRFWLSLDEDVLRPLFGGPAPAAPHARPSSLGRRRSGLQPVPMSAGGDVELPAATSGDSPSRPGGTAARATAQEEAPDEDARR